MKILIIDNGGIISHGGKLCVYKSTGEFGAELVQLGNEVEYFQLCHESENTISNYDLQNHGIKVSISKLYNSKLLNYFIAYLKAMQRVYESDFIYIFFPNTFKYLALFASIMGKKYGLYVRGQIGISSWVSNILYKYAYVVFTVSSNFTNAINKRLLNDKAHTIKPMISFTEKDIVNNRVYNKTNNFQLLYVGRVDKNKGLYELLDSIKRLKENCSFDFHLNIVGDGSELPFLKKKVAELGIHNLVYFSGHVTNLEEIKRLYIQSDIYILPTYHEGFPRTLYEAMLFGIPIATTFVGGIPGIMTENYNCYRIEPKSVSSIFDKLEYIMIHYIETSEVAKNAIETMSQIFNRYRMSHAQHLNQIINN
jgi:glycosyltransferase involved in cell wall biosynthesis